MECCWKRIIWGCVVIGIAHSLSVKVEVSSKDGQVKEQGSKFLVPEGSFVNLTCVVKDFSCSRIPVRWVKTTKLDTREERLIGESEVRNPFNKEFTDANPSSARYQLKNYYEKLEQSEIYSFLTIKEFGRFDAGTYECAVGGKVGKNCKDDIKSHQVNVFSDTEPTVELIINKARFLQPQLEVNAGERLNITCNVTGLAKPQAQIKIGSNTIVTKDQMNLNVLRRTPGGLGALQTTLILNNRSYRVVETDHRKSIICEAKDLERGPMSSDSVQLTVKYPPVADTEETLSCKASQSALNDIQAKLTCTVHANPPPTTAYWVWRNGTKTYNISVKQKSPREEPGAGLDGFEASSRPVNEGSNYIEYTLHIRRPEDGLSSAHYDNYYHLTVASNLGAKTFSIRLIDPDEVGGSANSLRRSTSLTLLTTLLLLIGLKLYNRHFCC